MSAVVIDLNDVQPMRPDQDRYDIDLIVARLRESAESWVQQLFANGKRVGDDWRLANIRGDAPRKNGSCVITLKGPHAGDWIDFDGNDGGGPINAIEQATGLGGRELIKEAAEIAGVLPGAPKRRPASAPKAKKRDPRLEIEHILSAAVPAKGTPVEQYLRGRGLELPPSADLRFHPDLTHWDTKTGYPAMLGLVRNDDGSVVGLHRTYLDVAADGSVTKANLAKAKMMLGQIAGGAVCLGGPLKGDLLAISEGIETGLAASTADPDLPVWATLSTSGMEQVHLPVQARRVLILADNDRSGAGLRAAEAAARHLRAEGREVSILLAPEEGSDFNDLLRAKGPEVLRHLLKSAQTKRADPDAPHVGQHRPVNYQGVGTSLPVLRADEGDLARATERVWTLLMSSNRTPWLFRYAGLPTWVELDDEGRPVARALSEERLRHMLARLASWRRLNAKGELVSIAPPRDVVKSTLATPDPALPVLIGIVNTPVFGRGGTLLTSPGYHPDARLLYVPADGFEVPDIPKNPSRDEITAARNLICDDLLGDFPFVGEAERAHVVALLLLGFLRGMIEGPTPLHLIEKPTPGTGATLMVDSIATILTGSGASVMTEGRDDEEWRKRVTAKLRQIPSILLIDNLRAKLDSSAVAAALTAPFWEDRILGASEMVRLPIRCLWIATGNNPEFSNEMARRLVRIRLDANIERPWQRENFRHPDLMTWVRASRPLLVAACLTLCQAWIAAGRPQGSRTIGSYENWAHVIGGVLDVAGIGGFLGNLDEMMAASDSEGAAWSGFIAAWWDRFGTAETGAADLFNVAMFCDPQPPVSGHTDRAQKTSFGIAIRKMRDRVFQVGDLNLRLVKAGTAQRATRWQLKVFDPKNLSAKGANPAKKSEPRASEVNLGFGGSLPQPIENIGPSEPSEPSEPLSTPIHMRAHAHTYRTTGLGSLGSPGSQTDVKSNSYESEPRSEPQNEGSPRDNPPDWLREVLE